MKYTTTRIIIITQDGQGDHTAIMVKSQSFTKTNVNNHCTQIRQYKKTQ